MVLPAQRPVKSSRRTARRSAAPGYVIAPDGSLVKPAEDTEAGGAAEGGNAGGGANTGGGAGGRRGAAGTRRREGRVLLTRGTAGTCDRASLRGLGLWASNAAGSARAGRDERPRPRP